MRPKGESRADVDIIVVTDLHEEDYTPQQAINFFKPFVAKHYTNADGTPKYRIQGRSIGIELSYVDLDLVITSAPSESQRKLLKSQSLNETETLESTGELSIIKSLVEAEESRFSSGSSWALPLLERSIKAAIWQSEPLRIPDRDAKEWKPTHPLAQIQWTWQKNKLCNGYYINVVQAIKWWRRLNDVPKYPKGYPVEHLIGQHCPNSITSVAQGLVLTLESIAASYSFEIAQGTSPYLVDHGVADHDVFGRVTGPDFKAFHALICVAAKAARAAFDETDASKSSELWRQFLGDKFPLNERVTNSSRIITPSVPASNPAGSGPRPLKDNPYF